MPPLNFHFIHKVFQILLTGIPCDGYRANLHGFCNKTRVNLQSCCIKTKVNCPIYCNKTRVNVCVSKDLKV